MAQPHQEEQNDFVRDVATRGSLPSRVSPEAAAGAVMCTLTERLTAGEAHHVLESLPAQIRPLFELCVRHREGIPVDKFDRAEFIERVAAHLGVPPTHAEAICRSVFDAVQARLPHDVVRHVGSQLPHELQELWLETSHPSPKATDAAAAHDQVLASIAREAALSPELEPEEAFSAVMCTLAQRLSGGEAEHVYLGLPDTLRPLIARCIVHRREPAETFDADELVRRVGDHLATSREDAERIVRAVISAVKRVLPDHEIASVASQLPDSLRALWCA